MKAAQQRNVMDVHKTLRHPNEKISRVTAKAVGIELTAKCGPCQGCAMAKIHCHIVPKRTDSRVAVKRG